MEEDITDVFADEEVNPEYDLIKTVETHLATAIRKLREALGE